MGTTHEVAGYDIFISYASQDRDRVLPVVDQLERRGARIWIDRQQIAGGTDYTQEIPRAIARSKSVLLFVLSSAYRSRNVKKELNIAEKKGKPVVPVRLEDVEPPEEFEWNLTAVQYVDLFQVSDESCISRILASLEGWKIKLDESGKVSGTTLAEHESTIIASDSAASPLIPYLVNRLQQERELRDALREHSRSGSRRPMIFFVYARAEQAVHEYLERLKTVSLPRALSRHGYSDLLYWCDVSWMREGWHMHPERTVKHLRDDIEDKLELPPDSWPRGILDKLTKQRSAMAVCYRVRWESWGPAHLDTIRAWAQDWGMIPNTPPGHPLIIIFNTEYGAIEKTFTDRILRRRPTRHPIHGQLHDLKLDINGPGLRAWLLPELGNVTLEDVEDWILNQVRPADAAGMIRLARTFLDDPELFAASGAAMQPLADRLRRLLE